MSQSTSRQSGFSAVELLITLFIAVAFLATGHQLYTSIISDSGATRQQAKASNVAYDYLRRYTGSIAAPCSASTPLSNSTVSPVPDGLSNVKVTVTISCPQSSLTSLSKVEVRVTYGADSQEVVHAMYATQ